MAKAGPTLKKYRVAWMVEHSVTVLAASEDDALKLATETKKYQNDGDKDFVEAELDEDSAGD